MTSASRRRRTTLWIAAAVAVGASALIAAMASAKPAPQLPAQSLLLGRPAPAITGPGLSGGHYTLAQFRGKWVLVNFMATWCPPCQQEMPQLADFARQQDTDAVVFTVAYDAADAGRLRTFLADHGAHWPAVDDPTASVSYGLSGLPSSFLVTPDGIVYAYVPGQVKAATLDGWVRQANAKGSGGA